VYNPETSEQQYFNAHTDLITCLRAYVLPNKQTVVATGEAGRLPKILVWTTGTLDGRGPELLTCLRGIHKGGVAQVCSTSPYPSASRQARVP
jgi:hypothetical protein